LGPAKENIYALESQKGYIVPGCWELKREFRMKVPFAPVSTKLERHVDDSRG
jgi:hypothetical protein